jgi:carotenoid cleavage dioxygenase-like enzyme
MRDRSTVPSSAESVSTPPSSPLGFRTQPTETAATLPVVGNLPPWLQGTFLLNGPGRFEVGGRPYGHWFDPPALVRRFRIDGSEDPDDAAVAYRCRFLRSEDYEWVRRRGRVRTAQPGTAADRPFHVRLTQALTGEFTDNASIGFVRIAGDVLAVTESPVGHRLDPDSLTTTGRVDLAAGLDADVTLGHVHYDADRRTFVGLGVSYGRDRGYVLFRRPAGTTVPTQVTHLPFDDLPYVHSFGLTDRYAVVPEYPFGVSTTGLVRALASGGTFLDAFEARPGQTRFHVLDRTTGGVVARPRADRSFVYHVANAYEVAATDDADAATRRPSSGTDPDAIVFDAVAYPDGRALTGLTLANVRAGAPDVPGGNLVRYRLPLSGDRASRELLYEGAVEFPTIHYRRYNGRPYRYCYLADAAGDGALPTRLVKVDVETGARTTWDPTPGWTAAEADSDPASTTGPTDGGSADVDDPPHPSEATFVPAPDPDAEDDGLLVTLVLDPTIERSRLVVLDAADLSVRARAPLPDWTPYPFHGQYYAAADPVRTMQ